MNTRSIQYIEENEDRLEIEVDLALDRTIAENFIAYCEHIIANCSMAGIDITKIKGNRKIYYLENE